MKIRLLWPGKTKSNYYRLAIEDYAGRVRRFVSLEIVEVREESVKDRQKSRRIRAESKHLSVKRKSGTSVLLDPMGKMMTSEEFSDWLFRTAGDVDFILGGPEGAESDPVSLRLSLGKMTLPHELARVVLLEQIYRAIAIQHGLPYHK